MDYFAVIMIGLFLYRIWPLFALADEYREFQKGRELSNVD